MTTLTRSGDAVIADDAREPGVILDPGEIGTRQAARESNHPMRATTGWTPAEAPGRKA